MSSDDKKCLNTDSCKKANFGICTECINGFILDKTDDLCKNITDSKFNNCKISLDGKICSECNDGYFLSENNICTKSSNCLKADNNSTCIECSEGYFLSKSENICTTEENCKSANSQLGIF